MPRKRLDWIILAAVVTLLGWVWIGMTSVKPSTLNTTGKPARADLGYPAPDFTLSTPSGGTVSLSDFKGKPVVLNFWATWCPPCRAELPAFAAAHNQWQGEITIIGVDVQESAEQVLPFLSELEVSYPIALDTYAEVGRAYNVVSFPTTYFIDSQGVIVKIDTGQLNEVLLQNRLADLAGR